MHIKVIACKVLLRELYALAAQSRNLVDIHWLRQALHNEPGQLTLQVQQAIDQAEREDPPYDAICLGYGLCCNGTLGLHAQKTPLVIPRAHDCITLLLGSKEAYQDEFNRYHGGAYWYSPGWIEHALQPGEARYKKTYGEYVAKYGMDNAQYLMEAEQGWMKEYHTAVYIRWQELCSPQYERYTMDCARYMGWEYACLDGKSTLLSNMLEGNWHPEDFCIIQPGEQADASFDEAIFCVKPSGIQSIR